MPLTATLATVIIVVDLFILCRKKRTEKVETSLATCKKEIRKMNYVSDPYAFNSLEVHIN
jgi:hypothetical protein